MFPESNDRNNIELGATLLTTTRGSVCNKKWLQRLIKNPTTSRANYEESASPLSSVELRVTNDIAGIVKEKDLKSLLEFGGVGRVCDVLRGQIHHSSVEVIILFNIMVGCLIKYINAFLVLLSVRVAYNISVAPTLLIEDTFD
jgi:hypothetical protein